MSGELLQVALDFAARGWPVFPCSPQNKRPLLPRDRDANGEPIKGSGGVSKASTDPEQIREWWRKWPQAMIGLSVGRAGLFVLDFDPRHDAESGEVFTLDRLKAETEAQIGCELPATLAARTPSGGVHLYFRMPAGDPITNRGNLPQHVDVRGLGGYVIAPPSICVGDGKNANGPYRWLRGLADAPIAEAPAELVETLRAKPGAGGAAPGGTPARDRRTPAAPAFLPPSAIVDERIAKWAQTALDAELDELQSTPKGGGRHGGRNQGAFWAAFNLGQIVGAGALPFDSTRAALIAVVRGFDPGAYAQHETAIDNGLDRGMAKPRDLSTVGQAPARSRPQDPPAWPSPHPGEGDYSAYPSDLETEAAPASLGGQGGRIRVPRDDELDRHCAFLPLTDLGNAERFRARHGQRFRFCKELGWFLWDGRRWAQLSEEKDKVPGEVSFAVFETVRAIRNEADFIEESGRRDIDEQPEIEADGELDFVVLWKGSGDNKTPVYWSDQIRAHAKSSEGSNRLGCIANLAKAFAEIAIGAEDLDRDRMAINVLNGTLRLDDSGANPIIRLDQHRPADLITKLANVAFNDDADAPVYDEFLAAVQPDETMRRFLNQWGGLSLTGDISEQKLAFFHGKGRNGKSTLVDAWAGLAGDYGGSVGIETFLEQGKGRKGGDATPDLARLPGVRFLRTSEPEKGAKLAEALIKLVTGGEAITARYLNKGFFDFLPSFKLTISGNHQPKITGHDDGIWRRVMLVPWDVQIAAEAVDRALPGKLKAEASGILNRLLQGLIDRQINGLVEPEAVISATQKYRERSDQLGRFLAECTIERSDARSKSSTLFSLFLAWSRATGGAEWQPVGFSRAMEDRGFEKKTSNGVQWLGLEMTRSPEDFEGGEASERGDDPRPRRPIGPDELP